MVSLRQVEATAPGKLLLLGEYAILAGAQALVAAVARRAKVTLRAAEVFSLEARELGLAPVIFTLSASGWPLFPPAVRGELRSKLRLFSCIWQVVTSTTRAPLRAVQIILDTSQFFAAEGYKLGLGASAALSVSLVSALLHFWQLRGAEDLKYIFQLAQQAHRKFQEQQGSGVDIAASVFGGVSVYSLKRGSREPAVIRDLDEPELGYLCTPLEIRILRDNLQICGVFIGSEASTPKLLRQVASYAEHKSQSYHQSISFLTKHSAEAINALQAGDLTKFIALSTLYSVELQRFSEQLGGVIVTPAHRALQEGLQALAQQEGWRYGHELLYKTSGAGGGDMGLLLCKRELWGEPKVKVALRETLQALGGVLQELSLGVPGLQVQLVA